MRPPFPAAEGLFAKPTVVNNVETLAAAARVYTRTRIGGRHRPFFNVTITNVPGPPVPLYVAGARIHSAFGMAPILDGLGLILVVLS